MTSFDGFPDTRRTFLRQIAKRQDREWFKAHKAQFNLLWNQPMQALLHDARSLLRKDYGSDLALPHVFRMYRDVRFSRDKMPLKTHVAGTLDWNHGATDRRMQKPVVLYFHVGLDETTAAAGRYFMEGAVLQKFRDQLLDKDVGATWGRLLSKLERKGFVITAYDQLKTAPRGVDPQHPRIAWLRLKGLVVRFPAIAPSLLAERKLLTSLVSHARAAAPLVHRLAQL